MGVQKLKLKVSIAIIMQEMMSKETYSIDEFAERLSSAIDEYVKEAEIIYESGLSSATGGVVTGTFIGKLN